MLSPQPVQLYLIGIRLLILFLILLYTIINIKTDTTPIVISTKTIIPTLIDIQIYGFMATRNPTTNATTAPTMTNIAILSMVIFPMDTLMI